MALMRIMLISYPDLFTIYILNKNYSVVQVNISYADEVRCYDTNNARHLI